MLFQILLISTHSVALDVVAEHTGSSDDCKTNIAFVTFIYPFPVGSLRLEPSFTENKGVRTERNFSLTFLNQDFSQSFFLKETAPNRDTFFSQMAIRPVLLKPKFHC